MESIFKVQRVKLVEPEWLKGRGKMVVGQEIGEVPKKVFSFWSIFC